MKYAKHLNIHITFLLDLHFRIYLILLCFFLFAFFQSCNENNCDKLPSQYSSYAEAKHIIKSTQFKVEETVNTSKSSWIKGASFYSCDGKEGYFILETSKEDYLYANMPIDVWEGFKNAESFGTYYNRYIKHAN